MFLRDQSIFVQIYWRCHSRAAMCSLRPTAELQHPSSHTHWFSNCWTHVFCRSPAPALKCPDKPSSQSNPALTSVPPACAHTIYAENTNNICRQHLWGGVDLSVRNYGNKAQQITCRWTTKKIKEIIVDFGKTKDDLRCKLTVAV